MTGLRHERAARRARQITARREARRTRRHQPAQQRLRSSAFAAIAVLVLAGGVYLAAGDLLGQRGSATDGAAIPVRMSMAGFTPSEIRVPAGEKVALELWTTDSPAHLDGGVHTMISDDLDFYFELPGVAGVGESRATVTLLAPQTPGVYDIYCDTCCGGRDAPTMNGTLVVEG
jgi:cytochrome c oxidase subunit II